MIDELGVAGARVVVALVITTDGTKVPVGLWLGDTENTTVVTALLADLVARGLDVGLRRMLLRHRRRRRSPRASRKVFGDALDPQHSTCTSVAM